VGKPSPWGLSLRAWGRDTLLLLLAALAAGGLG